MSSAGETPFDSLHLRYERVREQLADEIERERRPAGSRLPPERAMAEHYGVSRATLRRALDELAQDGVVERVPGGWAVASRVVGEPPNELMSFSEMAASRGLTPGGRVLDRGRAARDDGGGRRARSGARGAAVRTRTPAVDGRRADPHRSHARADGARGRDRRGRRSRARRCTRCSRIATASGRLGRGSRWRRSTRTRDARSCWTSSPGSRCCDASSRPRTRPAGRSSSARWSTDSIGTGSGRRSCAEPDRWVRAWWWSTEPSRSRWRAADHVARTARRGAGVVGRDSPPGERRSGCTRSWPRAGAPACSTRRD